LDTLPKIPAEIPVDLHAVPTADEPNRLRRLAVRRLTSALVFSVALGVFFLTLPASSRSALIDSLVDNRGFIGLLLLFGIVALSLLWAGGQQLDVWLFKLLNVETPPSIWIDRGMFASTQIGNVSFAVIVSVIAYVLGERRFAIMFTLGSLSLLLLVTIIKSFTDRARPYKTLREARLVGWQELGLSFPSGHTTQAFFTMSLIIRHFEAPLGIAVVLYAIATLVGATRIYLGVHYPRDVIAGGMLGVVWGIVTILVSPYF